MSEECKVCGKIMKTMTVAHMKTHGLNKKEYEAYKPKEKEIEVIEETEDKVIDSKLITEKDKIESIFGEPKTNIDKPLNMFLDEFNITEKELRNLIMSYKSGNPIDVELNIKRKAEFGEKSAKELKDLPTVDTTKLATAEALVNKYGFKVTSVTSNPKTWHLKR